MLGSYIVIETCSCLLAVALLVSSDVTSADEQGGLVSAWLCLREKVSVVLPVRSFTSTKANSGHFRGSNAAFINCHCCKDGCGYCWPSEQGPSETPSYGSQCLTQWHGGPLSHWSPIQNLSSMCLMLGSWDSYWGLWSGKTHNSATVWGSCTRVVHMDETFTSQIQNELKTKWMQSRDSCFSARG